MSTLAGVLFWLVILAFAAAQGAAVFSTAYLGLRLIKSSHWFAKIAAISVSYWAWIIATVAAYFAIGGDGSFMKGFAIVIILCFTALASTFFYMLAWLIWPFARKDRPLAIMPAA